MKKLFLFLLVLPFVFGSCSKDDNDTLDGTTWEAYESYDGLTYKSTVTFQKSTFNVSGYEEYDGYRDEFSGSGTYTYDHPNVFLIEDGTGERTTGTVSGNKMTIVDIVYTKK
jgi:hypothetical protein